MDISSPLISAPEYRDLLMRSAEDAIRRIDMFDKIAVQQFAIENSVLAMSYIYIDV